jgi:aminoglycoside 3-N-acetyltransferase I
MMNHMNYLSIRVLKPGDEKELQRLLQLYIDVFGDRSMPQEMDYLTAILQQDNTLFVAAYLNEELVGGITAHIQPSIYGKFNELYIYDMAVSQPHQRHGIGSQMLDFVKSYSKEHGIIDLFVQADTVDTEARNFYKKNGGVEEDVRHYDFKVT